MNIINTILIILLMIGLLFLALFFSSRRTWSACRFILNDLKRQQALTPETAVELPYCQRRLLRLGFRDYRPQALNFLVSRELVRVSPEGRFYLGDEQAIDGLSLKGGRFLSQS
ncbi:MAG: hypothetical protein FWE89_00135 [Syntrophaceae bacterium]|nr:hypothetical protein [Syntrophaceae bacterium]